MKSKYRRITLNLSISLLASLSVLLVDHSIAGSKSQQSKNQASAGNDNFARADANHDGKLDRGELGDYLVYEMFATCDSNRDGKISLNEWLRVKPGGAADFKERDANHDGFVTLAEAISYGRRGGAGLSLLKKADKNRDGKVDRAELQAYFAKQ